MNRQTRAQRIATAMVALVGLALVGQSTQSAEPPEALGNKFVSVAAGPFVMGDHDGQYDEKPPRLVHLSAFSIQRYEVTQGDYLACVRAQRCATPKILAASPRHPVVGVTWKDAQAYCAFRGWRLPTEAQWEKAARGTDARRYPWGGRDERGGTGRAQCGAGCDGTTPQNGRTNGPPKTQAVAVDAHVAGASPCGALNMAGNVEEWVADWYGEGYYRNMPARDPVGPTSGSYKAVRGGEHSQSLDVLRASNRYWAPAAAYNGRRGFRCAK